MEIMCGQIQISWRVLFNMGWTNWSLRRRVETHLDWTTKAFKWLCAVYCPVMSDGSATSARISNLKHVRWKVWGLAPISAGRFHFAMAAAWQVRWWQSDPQRQQGHRKCARITVFDCRRSTRRMWYCPRGGPGGRMVFSTQMFYS